MKRAAAASRVLIAADAPPALARLRGRRAKARASATAATSRSRHARAKSRPCAPAAVANRKNAAPADSTREYNFQIKKRGRLMTDYERYGEYQPSERSVLGTGITMLLIGLGAGALPALLLAPRSSAVSA